MMTSLKKSNKRLEMMKQQVQRPQMLTTLPIPVDVIYDNLIPFLSFRDLLRFRRVSKHINSTCDKFIRHHFQMREGEINETDCTFATFIQRNLPSCAIYLNNSGPRFFEDAEIPEFLCLYADKITHLRVMYFSVCSSPAEYKFFQALTNLQHLELEYTEVKRAKRTFLHSFDANDQKALLKIRDRWYFPPTFRNLKTLKFNMVQVAELCDQNYAVECINFCTQLEYLKHPYHTIVSGTSCFKYVDDADFVIKAVESKLKKCAQGQSALKTYDLEYRQEKFSCWNLIKLCNRADVKLVNFDAAFYDRAGISSTRPDHEIYSVFGEPLVSIINVDRNMFWTEMPNLEYVVIKSTAECSFEENWENDDGEDRNQPRWPKLSMLDINIDSMMLAESEDHPPKPTTALFDFLFASDERENLTDLRIRFDHERLSKGCICRMALPHPRVVDIAKSCRFVTKLTLSNWMGTSNAIAKFWTGLPELEEVTIEKCKLIEEDAAFVGKNHKEPALLKLTKLKKFALRGLDLMPKITDQIFMTVFCGLKISEFQITSKTPLKSITINGIRSLLSGEFNACVEKFSFDGWSLENVSRVEFAILKSQFRASRML